MVPDLVRALAQPVQRRSETVRLLPSHAASDASVRGGVAGGGAPRASLRGGLRHGQHTLLAIADPRQSRFRGDPAARPHLLQEPSAQQAGGRGEEEGEERVRIFQLF